MNSKWAKYMLNIFSSPRKTRNTVSTYQISWTLKQGKKTWRNFYDFMKKICDKIFVTSRKDKKLIISLLYKELTSATGMKWNRIEGSETLRKYENLVHDKDGILNLWDKIKYSVCIEIVGQAFGTQNESSASSSWLKYLNWNALRSRVML